MAAWFVPALVVPVLFIVLILAYAVYRAYG